MRPRYATREEPAGAASSDDRELLADPLERLERLGEVLLGVVGRHDRSDSRRPLRHGREHDGRGEDALLEQLARELLRDVLLAGDDRRDRRLARAGVEPEVVQALFEEPGSVPTPREPPGLV